MVPNYALCPGASTIPQITLQMVRAVAWTWHNIAPLSAATARRITVAGHSAGGQLAAMMLACLWQQHDPALPRDLVSGALAISALHDLEPIMHTPFLQATLQLTPEQVAQASPAACRRRGTARCIRWRAATESEEYHRQNRLIQEAWGARRVPVCELVPGLNHFSVLDALVEPSHRLHQLALDLLRA